MSTDRFRTVDSLALFVLDALSILASFSLAYQLRRILPYPEPLVSDIPFETYNAMFAVQAICVLFILFLNRQYYIPRAPSRLQQLYNMFNSVTVGVLLTIAISTFLFKGETFLIDFPRAMILYSWLITIFLLVVARIFHHAARDWLRSRGYGEDRIIIVGTGEVAKLTLQRIAWSRRLGYHVVGIVDPRNTMQAFGEFPILGAPEDLPNLIETHNIDEVIIAMPEHGHREVVRVVGFCQRGRVSIKIFPDVFQFITEQATIDDLGGLPLLTVRDFAMRGYMLIFKRLLDIVGASIGLILFSPGLLLTALLVKLESSGPAFFVQERMGLDGRLIQMIKFRSMRLDAEKSGPGWTVKDDPRRTRIGGFLRKVNLDEFPQLINVLLGEMSLVGPRPEQPYYVDQFRKEMPNYMQRHLLPSGMTGWAQVNGLRGDTSITERTKYDLWYIENWSLGLDITIIVRTLWMMATNNNEGAG